MYISIYLMYIHIFTQMYLLFCIPILSLYLHIKPVLNIINIVAETSLPTTTKRDKVIFAS